MKVMKKIKERGVEYVQTETERLGRMMSELRCLSSLSLTHSVLRSCCPSFPLILTGGAISAKKSDEFTKKRNVLKKFEL